MIGQACSKTYFSKMQTNKIHDALKKTVYLTIYIAVYLVKIAACFQVIK